MGDLSSWEGVPLGGWGRPLAREGRERGSRGEGSGRGSGKTCAGGGSAGGEGVSGHVPSAAARNSPAGSAVDSAGQEAVAYLVSPITPEKGPPSVEPKRDALNCDDPRPDTGETAHGDQEQVDSAIAAFRQGIDRDKNFRLLFDSYYCLVHKFFTKRVSSTEDRLDLTQEVFLRVYRGLEGYRGEAQFGTWLFRIAHNTYLKWLRRTEREQSGQATFSRGASAPRSGDPEQTGWEEETAAVDEETPLEEVLRQERLQKLREAIAELPEQMRWCTELRLYQDLSYREISVVMRRSVETVKVHLFQARKKLQERLREAFEDIDFGEAG